MNCWSILGIAETQDDEVIREAYRQKLPQCHPEENPEGFRQLRGAMEEALQLAAEYRRRQKENEGKSKAVEMLDSPEIQDFLHRTEDLYRDYGRRILPEQWRALLNCSLCQDLETQREASWALLNFLMDHYYLPQVCFQVMEETFGWIQDKDELEKHFPQAFIDALVQWIEDADNFRYELLQLKEDTDDTAFFHAYYGLQRAVQDGEQEKAEACLDKLDEMGIVHPDVTLLKIRHFSMINGEEEHVWELAKDLYETDSQFPMTRYWYIYSAMQVEDSGFTEETLEKEIGRMKEENPDYFGYWRLMEMLLERQERREEQMELYEQIIAHFGESSQIYWRQANLREKEGKTDEAFIFCEKALKVGFHRDAFNLRTEILLERKEYATVKEEISSLMRQGYAPAQVLYNYAKALRHLEEYPEAEKVLLQLEEQTQGSDLVQEELALLYNDMDRPEDALLWMDKALERRDTPGRQFKRSTYLHQLKRYAEEIEIYQYLIGKGIDSAFVYCYMGRAQEELNQLAEAEASFRQALEKDKESGGAWDGLGDMLQKQKKWKEAEEAYAQGAACGHLQATRDLCRILKRTQQNDRAIECIKAGLERWPEDGSLILLYADIWLRKKEFAKTMQWLNRYMEVRPEKTAYAYEEMAGCCEQAKDLDKAEEYYQKAVDHQPDNARPWRMMGKFLAEKKNAPERALPYLEKAAQLQADGMYVWMKLGEVYEELGRTEEAQSCYQKSWENYQKEIADDPLDGCNYEGAADVLVHLGRLEEAEKMIQQAFALESYRFGCNRTFCYEACEDFSKLEQKRGNWEEALEWMKKAAEGSTSDYYEKELAKLEEKAAANVREP